MGVSFSKEVSIPNGVYIDDGELMISLGGSYYSINLKERHLFERYLDSSKPMSFIQIATIKGDYADGILNKKYTDLEKLRDSEELIVHNSIRGMLIGIMSGMSSNGGRQVVGGEVSYSFELYTTPGFVYESYEDKLIIGYSPTKEYSIHTNYYLINVLYKILEEKWKADLEKDKINENL
jgi:hypothetical protein